MNKVLVLGARGMLGKALLDVFGDGAVGWDRTECDVTASADLRLKIEDLSPEAIINCVAYNDVDGAEKNPEGARRLNVEVVKNLSEIANELDVPLVHISTNYVFDGGKGDYQEQDRPAPLSVYGQSKLDGERAVMEICKKYYLVRTAVLFGPKGESELSKKSFVDLMLSLSAKTNHVKAVEDETNSLTYAPDLAVAIKKLLESHLPFGIYHIVNSGQASWYDFAKKIFDLAKRDVQLEPVPASQFERAAKRPKLGVLANTKLPPLRSWQDALKEYVSQIS